MIVDFDNLIAYSIEKIDKSFSDFQEPYSQELVKAVRSKRRALQ